MCRNARHESEVGVIPITKADLQYRTNFFTFNISKISDKVCSEIVLFFSLWHVIVLEYISVSTPLLCPALPRLRVKAFIAMQIKWSSEGGEQHTVLKYTKRKYTLIIPTIQTQERFFYFFFFFLKTDNLFIRFIMTDRGKLNCGKVWQFLKIRTIQRFDLGKGFIFTVFQLFCYLTFPSPFSSRLGTQ